MHACVRVCACVLRIAPIDGPKKARDAPRGPQEPLGGGMAAQAVSGPVLGLILALVWNRENRAQFGEEFRGVWRKLGGHLG